MRQALQELYNLLLEQRDALEGLLELSREERRVIISGEAQLLEDVVRRELRALSKLGAIEKRRAALHPAVAEELGIPGEDITVSVITGKAQPGERELFKRLQTELTALISTHTALNTENRELINAHMEYTESLMDLMVDSEDPLNNFYGGDGKTAPDRKKATGFFDGHA